ncbi:unnamed protein product [Blepharisma stoltei]|uniref:RING-type domain-containing protein n=1 Tax=Blepharisma stoltei TaxID=1481888 RepID=A0AAU9JDR4_9CILI|nr:unnamed protein product [Blepharisma stoltei]
MTIFDFGIVCFALWILLSFIYKPTMTIRPIISEIYNEIDHCIFCAQENIDCALLNCGHQHCASCILLLTYKYWKLSCPICRSPISFIKALFKEDGNSEMIEKINFFNLFHNSAEWEKCILVPKYLFKYTSSIWWLVIMVAIYYIPLVSEASSTVCKEM